MEGPVKATSLASEDYKLGLFLESRLLQTFPYISWPFSFKMQLSSLTIEAPTPVTLSFTISHPSSGRCFSESEP